MSRRLEKMVLEVAFHVVVFRAPAGDVKVELAFLERHDAVKRLRTSGTPERGVSERSLVNVELAFASCMTDDEATGSLVRFDDLEQ